MVIEPVIERNIIQFRDGSLSRTLGKPIYFHTGFGGRTGLAFFASGFGISAFGAEAEAWKYVSYLYGEDAVDMTVPLAQLASRPPSYAGFGLVKSVSSCPNISAAVFASSRPGLWSVVTK